MKEKRKAKEKQKKNIKTERQTKVIEKRGKIDERHETTSTCRLRTNGKVFHHSHVILNDDTPSPTTRYTGRQVTCARQPWLRVRTIENPDGVVYFSRTKSPRSPIHLTPIIHRQIAIDNNNSAKKLTEILSRRLSSRDTQKQLSRSRKRDSEVNSRKKEKKKTVDDNIFVLFVSSSFEYGREHEHVTCGLSYVRQEVKNSKNGVAISFVEDVSCFLRNFSATFQQNCVNWIADPLTLTKLTPKHAIHPHPPSGATLRVFFCIVASAVDVVVVVEWISTAFDAATNFFINRIGWTKR